MKSRIRTLALLPAALLVTASAFAAEPCDSDDWFCEQNQATSESPKTAESSGSIDIRPSAEPAPAADEPDTPPQPFVIESASSEPVGATNSSPTYKTSTGYDGRGKSRRHKAKKERDRHFGFNLRLASLMMEKDKQTHPKAGMSGVGVGLRFMPAPFLALEPGIDGLSGRDELGRQRSETTLSFNTVFFLNPDDPIQIYGLLGVFTTSAEVKGTDTAPVSHGGRFSYVGGQIGAGIELRLAPALAFNGEVIGYARQRNELPSPEESSAQLRRDSGGGLLRGGMSLYF